MTPEHAIGAFGFSALLASGQVLLTHRRTHTDELALFGCRQAKRQHISWFIDLQEYKEYAQTP